MSIEDHPIDIESAMEVKKDVDEIKVKEYSIDLDLDMETSVSSEKLLLGKISYISHINAVIVTEYTQREVL